jgi:hypothetical protein
VRVHSHSSPQFSLTRIPAVHKICTYSWAVLFSRFSAFILYGGTLDEGLARLRTFLNGYFSRSSSLIIIVSFFVLGTVNDISY